MWSGTRIKSETIQFISEVFSTPKADPNQDESNCSSHYDPISGTYKVLTVACSRFKRVSDEQRDIGRNLEHALHSTMFKSLRWGDAFSVKI
jgi:hypothetical protein